MNLTETSSPENAGGSRLRSAVRAIVTLSRDQNPHRLYVYGVSFFGTAVNHEPLWQVDGLMLSPRNNAWFVREIVAGGDALEALGERLKDEVDWYAIRRLDSAELTIEGLVLATRPSHIHDHLWIAADCAHREMVEQAWALLHAGEFTTCGDDIPF